MTENQYAISEADIIILAVKPCIVDEVLSPLRFSRTQILVSLVTGISISHLAHLSETEMPIFRVVPNIAITEHSSLTLITSRKAGKEHQQLIKQTFEEGGKCLFAEEKQLDIISALTSSGIAFALKYIPAAMQAGIDHDRLEMDTEFTCDLLAAFTGSDQNGDLFLSFGQPAEPDYRTFIFFLPGHPTRPARPYWTHLFCPSGWNGVF